MAHQPPSDWYGEALDRGTAAEIPEGVHRWLQHDFLPFCTTEAFRIEGDPRVDPLDVATEGVIRALCDWENTCADPPTIVYDTVMSWAAQRRRAAAAERAPLALQQLSRILRGHLGEDADRLAAVDRLQPRRRAVYHCQIVFRMSRAEAAEAVGMGKATVGTTLHFARKALRKQEPDLDHIEGLIREAMQVNRKDD
ncbi:sigma factor-like helix-turn-helix DNA-binding protein [Kitasatospora sp. NPDC056184]|uniref:sigma factor-like helix-turn-helix DNA-binding protein n=1 Tax=Kitasatospora sp. NPDC056184 TaxID=3345738 RepID=UPI0035E1F5DF